MHRRECAVGIGGTNRTVSTGSTVTDRDDQQRGSGAGEPGQGRRDQAADQAGADHDRVGEAEGAGAVAVRYGVLEGAGQQALDTTPWRRPGRAAGSAGHGTGVGDDQATAPADHQQAAGAA